MPTGTRLVVLSAIRHCTTAADFINVSAALPAPLIRIVRRAGQSLTPAAHRTPL